MCVWGVYFPFGRQNADQITPTIDAIKVSTSIPENFVIVCGDFNAERHHKKKYSAQLTSASLKKVQTPITGKPYPTGNGGPTGGKAQGIWATHPERILNVTVLDTYDALSNHHRPVVFEVEASHSETPKKNLNLHAEMRFVQPNSDIGAYMEEAKSFEDLMDIIEMTDKIRGKVAEM